MAEKELQKAKELFFRFREAIEKDDDCSVSLRKYRAAIETTRDAMKKQSIIAACASCSDRWQGGCCFEGVEGWYDPVLLLINLLLGVDVKERRTIRNGCLFLGPTGCTLLARHSFCINYLCDNLKNLLLPQDKINFLTTAGREIGCGVRAEQSIRKWLGINDNPDK